MIRTTLLTFLLTIAFISIGCDSSTARRPGQTISLQQVQYAAAFDASLDAMRESFPIQTRDLQTGRIVSRPVAYSGGEPSTGISTGLSGSTPELRRRAYITLSEHAEGCSLEVRVDIERRDTQDYQVYEGLMAAEDLRMRTPAERRDMASNQQREVWTFIRRDRAAEEQIIRRINQRLGLLTPSQ
ncbi:MAG: hypothetical protein GWP14_02595 [Actinobacteria bacterium]|nr:hypothetical protein [Actinomycetota bacterium]